LACFSLSISKQPSNLYFKWGEGKRKKGNCRKQKKQVLCKEDIYLEKKVKKGKYYGNFEPYRLIIME